MASPARRYNLIVFVLSGLVLGSTAACNFLIDPYALYSPYSWQELDEYKAKQNARPHVAEQVRKSSAQRFVLGSSRANKALSQVAQGDPNTANASLPGASAFEILRLADLVLEQPQVREIVWCADFFTFNNRRQPAPDFSLSRLAPQFNAVDFHLDKLLSANSFERSQEVLQRARNQQPWTAPMENVVDTVRPILRQYRFRPGLYGRFELATDEISALGSLARRCQAAEVRFTVVFLPIHATLLETLRDASIWEKYEDWKTSVVQTLPAEIPVWDFQTYAAHATTLVAETTDSRAALQYFQDPSHCTPRVGAWVWQRITEDTLPREATNSLKAPEAFGVRIDPNQIEQHLRQIRDQRAAYVRAHPEEVTWVQRLLHESHTPLKGNGN